MLEYTVIQQTGESNLINEVNEHIKAGWRPQGGVSMVLWTDPEGEYPHEYLYAQAMLRDLEGYVGGGGAVNQRREPRW